MCRRVLRRSLLLARRAESKRPFLQPSLAVEFVARNAKAEKVTSYRKKRQAKRQQRYRELSKLLQPELTTRYPHLFSLAAPKPMAIGIHKQLREACPDVSSRVIQTFLWNWTKRWKYIDCLKDGAIRLNLDGSESERVTTNVAHDAKTKLSGQG